MDTTYDNITRWFMDNLFFAILILICVVLAAIPQIMDGAMFIWNTIRKKEYTPKESDVFEIQYKEEKVVLQRLITSRQFDVVKVEAISHNLGIRAEYAWMDKFYPDYKRPTQALKNIQTQQGIRSFDVFMLKNGRISKKVFFDVTSFIDGPIGEFGDSNAYETKKILELYSKM